MSMPENWFAHCEHCNWRDTSDMPVSGEQEIRDLAKAHVAEFPTHRCQLSYELWLGWVKHE